MLIRRHVVPLPASSSSSCPACRRRFVPFARQRRARPASNRNIHTANAQRNDYIPSDRPRRTPKSLLRLRDSTPQPRHYASAQSSTKGGEPDKIAVLGGGITGLATVHYLVKEFPNAKVSLYEAQDSLGGWIRSTPIDLRDGQVVFEQGPRTLRPPGAGGDLTLQLIQELDLTKDLLVTPKTSPAAQNRFIYYPDHLVRMPGGSLVDLFTSLPTVLMEPAFKNVLRGVFSEVTKDQRDLNEIVDESVGSFISRRTHKDIANNLASAMLHGIYAGNTWELSARSLLPRLWLAEEKYEDFTSAFVASLLKREAWAFCDDMDLRSRLQTYQWDPELKSKVLPASVYTFKHGMQQLVTELVQSLEQKQNLTIRKSTRVSHVTRGEGASVKITSHSPTTENVIPTEDVSTFSHVVNTMSPSKLLSCIPAQLKKPFSSPSTPTLSGSLDAVSAVNVGVVNLYFRTPNLLQTLKLPGGHPRNFSRSSPLAGFGYLIPASIPFEQNPELALGVIFDSDAAPDVFSTIAPDKLGTKLTVMLGGHWWNGWSALPSAEECHELAAAVLRRHLGITEDPEYSFANIHRSCIPQYNVGYTEHMARAHKALLGTFSGRLRVAGSWYSGGVGVNDCIRAAWDTVRGLKMDAAGRLYMGQPHTGLEKHAWGRPAARCKYTLDGVIRVLEVEEAAVGMGYLDNIVMDEESQRPGKGKQK